LKKSAEAKTISRALNRTASFRTRHGSLNFNKKVNHEMPAERFRARSARENGWKLSLLNADVRKARKLAARKPRQINYCNINSLIGWGARTRTWEWRNQNPPNSFAITKSILHFWHDLPIETSKA
jgi:hypothetical protein